MLYSTVQCTMLTYSVLSPEENVNWTAKLHEIAMNLARNNVEWSVFLQTRQIWYLQYIISELESGDLVPDNIFIRRHAQEILNLRSHEQEYITYHREMMNSFRECMEEIQRHEPTFNHPYGSIINNTTIFEMKLEIAAYINEISNIATAYIT